MVQKSCCYLFGCIAYRSIRGVDTSQIISQTNVASVGSVFNDTRKVKVLSLPETIKEKSTFRAKVLRRAKAFVGKARRRAFARNDDFSCIVSGSERTFTFLIPLKPISKKLPQVFSSIV